LHGRARTETATDGHPPQSRFTPFRIGGSLLPDVQQLDRVVIRIAGDSGDGMRLTGDRFTQESATFGNELSTLPNFPAEAQLRQGHLVRRLRITRRPPVTGRNVTGRRVSS
jgi:hypothetical protein